MAYAVTSVQDIAKQLVARFDAPLDELEDRRLIIWHDLDGSFEDEFDRISSSGLGDRQEARPVVFAKIDEGSQFELKRRIYREESESDFLIYSRSQKDLSPRGLEGNWLADVELIAEHVQADFSSMLLDELGAVDSAVDGIERFKFFFGAAERKKKFTRLMPNAQTKEDIALGVMGVLLGSPDLSTAQMVKAYLIVMLDGGDPIAELAKYGADGVFGSYLQAHLGYDGDLLSVDDLMSHILMTALSCTMPEGALTGLENRISQQHGQFCLNVVDDWMHDETFGDDLFDLCRRLGDTYRPDSGFAESDSDKVIEWYGKEAAGGFSYSLGEAYLSGLGAEADPAKARDIFQKALDEGDRSAAMCMCALVLMNANGLGQDKDKEAAIDWCYKAIDACGPFDDSDNPEERLHKPLPYARYVLEHYGQPLELS